METEALLARVIPVNYFCRFLLPQRKMLPSVQPTSS